MTAPAWPPKAPAAFRHGTERSSKALNLGNLMRSAHAFGASFTFTIGATYQALEARADTSKGQSHLPHYNWDRPADLILPKGCRLGGCGAFGRGGCAAELPPPLAGGLCSGSGAGIAVAGTPRTMRLAVKIPTSFCMNVAMAGAIVMYDRTRSLAPFCRTYHLERGCRISRAGGCGADQTPAVTGQSSPGE